jgi:hypothetical protein
MTKRTRKGKSAAKDSGLHPGSNLAASLSIAQPAGCGQGRGLADKFEGRRKDGPCITWRRTPMGSGGLI